MTELPVPITPDAFISYHTATEVVSGPEVAGLAFGPFLNLPDLVDFERGRPDRCTKTILPLFTAPKTGLGAPLHELMILGALTFNWLEGITTDRVGHDRRCELTGLEVGDPTLCHCGWSSMYGRFLELSALARGEEVPL